MPLRIYSKTIEEKVQQYIDALPVHKQIESILIKAFPSDIDAGLEMYTSMNKEYANAFIYLLCVDDKELMRLNTNRVLQWFRDLGFTLKHKKSEYSNMHTIATGKILEVHTTIYLYKGEYGQCKITEKRTRPLKIEYKVECLDA